MLFLNRTNIKYIHLLIFSLSVTNLFAQKTDLQRDNLKGKVKSISFYKDSKLVKKCTYNLHGFETGLKQYNTGNALTSYLRDTFIYDPKGNMTKYIDDNFITDKKYDDANNLIEEILINKASKKILNKMSFRYVNFKKVKSQQTKYSFNSDSIEFTILINYIYDSNGNLIEEDNANTSHNITIRQKTTYNYDDSQNLIEKIESNDAGKMLYSHTYKYDHFNRRVEDQSRSFNGSDYTNYNEKFKYDIKGHIIESSHYKLDGKVLYKDVFSFDENGNQIKKSHYYGEVLRGEIMDEFNTSGLLISESEYISTLLVSKKAFKYDNKGNVIEALYTDANGAVKARFNYNISYY